MYYCYTKPLYIIYNYLDTCNTVLLEIVQKFHAIGFRGEIFLFLHRGVCTANAYTLHVFLILINLVPRLGPKEI